MDSNDYIFESKDYLAGFKNGRYVPVEIIDFYVSEVERISGVLGKVLVKILDLGCGNGRFAIPLALRNANFELTCLDSSSLMISDLEQKVNKHRINNIKLINKEYFQYNENISFDIIIMSEVIHLIRDKSLLFNKITSNLSKNGFLIIRTPLKENLASGDMYNFFPEALFIDERRHPSIQEIEYLIKNYNYLIFNNKLVREKALLSLDEYLDLYKNKIYSTLRQLPGDIFDERYKAMVRVLAEKSSVVHEIDVSLLIIRKHEKS